MSSEKGTKNAVASAALTAGLLALLSTPANAADYKSISKSSKAGDQVAEHSAGTFVVKCVGVAKGGANDCGALDGSHSCAGQSKVGDDYSDNEWAYLTIDQCADDPKGKFLMKGENGPVIMSKSEFQFKLVKE